MDNMNYVTAVARIRANENYLLQRADIDRLITAKTPGDALRVLADKGWNTESGDLNGTLRAENDRLWSLIRECAPDFGAFSALIVENDFHNYKAVLKGTVTGTDYDGLLLSPCITPVSELKKAVSERSFEHLPSYMREAASEAFDALAHTGDGQFADIRLDRAMLEATLELAEGSGEDFMKKLAEIIVAAADLRIAARGAKTKKPRQLLELAIAPCPTLEKQALLAAALQGTDILAEHIEHTPYAEAAAAMRETAPSLAGLEKWCDNAAVSYAAEYRYDPFGIAALAAFILSKRNEIKTARIVISAKRAGIGEEEIRGHVRKTG
ncbi:MAG TPA: V-type ATP synthase subunit C [Ruminococcaceae bacterium]|nr:V-type ATP synthase subunit C [Oscillospiraceae bacterium]